MSGEGVPKRALLDPLLSLPPFASLCLSPRTVPLSALSNPCFFPNRGNGEAGTVSTKALIPT